MDIDDEVSDIVLFLWLQEVQSLVFLAVASVVHGG